MTRRRSNDSALRGLVIKEPWIGKILRGEKTWEMRKTACHHRGRIALICKGSGLVVGVADVVDSLPPIKTRRAYADAERFHGVQPEQQKDAFSGGWTTPWVLANARPLRKPVRYEHPPGAVIWVNLDQAVVQAILAQVGTRAAVRHSLGSHNFEGI
jgi:hypothetical protein